ncbi:hypothetical protein [Planococcus salinarum]|uniref:hypothetical protein n=1 Tax=Planococcus salinarum TaxID=622695 RepID=UPI000E3E8DD4|nr:hypothetical protein [Planococcus salinarum]TAA71910.1 hypothetical protein D2909_08795 [Planococcus salinarum]
MKKLVIIGLSSLFFLSACGSDEAKETTDPANGGEASTDNTEVKKELMRFYMEVPNTINETDGELNAFEQQLEEGTLPEGEELTALKEAAAVSAEETSQAVGTIEIPGALEEETEELQSALAMISESYDLKVAALSEEETSFDAASEKFAEADSVFNTILEEYELIPSSIQNEVK